MDWLIACSFIQEPQQQQHASVSALRAHVLYSTLLVHTFVHLVIPDATQLPDSARRITDVPRPAKQNRRPSRVPVDGRRSLDA